MSSQILQRSSPVANRVFLLFIIFLFVAPLLAAWILVGRWHPEGSASHGELLDPAQPVAYLRLRLLDGRELSETFLRGRWTLAYANRAGSGCDQSCRRSLYNIRQVRLALGRNMARVQKLLLLDADPNAELAAWLKKEHQDLVVGVADRSTRTFFEKAFAAERMDEGAVYLIDPLGNLVLRYGDASDPSGMLKDLNRLLKLSKIG